MRILLVSFCIQTAGSHILTLCLASELAKKQNKVYLFIHNEQLIDYDLIKRYLDERVKIIAIKNYKILNFIAWKINSLLIKLGSKKSFHEKVKDWLFLFIIRYYKIEIINSHDLWIDRSRLNLLKRGRIPIVITTHGGYEMQTKVNDFSYIPYANKADAIVCVSENGRRLLQNPSRFIISKDGLQLGKHFIRKDFGADVNQRKFDTSGLALNTLLVTINNGIAWRKISYPTSARIILDISENAFVYGMVGRGTQQKGWQYAIDSFLSLPNKNKTNSYLILVGGSEYMNLLKAKYSSNPHIIFTGEVEDPGFYLDSFDVSLLLSCFSEGLPLVALESLFYGKPLIASKLGGIEGLIENFAHKKCGFLVNLDDSLCPKVEEISKYMLEYKKDENLWREHSKNAKELSTMFSIEECASNYYSLFKSLTSSLK